MARRKGVQTQNPDVEASQVELDSLEARKNTVQSETLAVAQNKQKLEEDFETAKERLNAELLEKQTETAGKIKTLTQACQKAQATTDAALKDADKATEQFAVEQKKLDAILRSIDISSNSLTKIEGRISSLVAEESSLIPKVSLLKKEIPVLENKKTTLEKDISAAGLLLTKTTKEHSQHTISLESDRKERAALIDTKQAKEKELSVVTDQIAKAKETLSGEENRLATVKKEAAEQTAAMIKEKTERDVHMGNLARLEQRVDGKVKHLAEIEKEFTTEHLARGGYKKLTE